MGTPARRCHPLLSGIANAAFYGGRLRDGCSASDRSPLLPGLPALAFVEVQGQAQVDGATRSSFNMAEVMQRLGAWAWAVPTVVGTTVIGCTIPWPSQELATRPLKDSVGRGHTVSQAASPDAGRAAAQLRGCHNAFGGLRGAPGVRSTVGGREGLR